LALAVSTSATTVPREPCIVIADVGGDDGLALLLALASTELEILGVASSFGSHSDVRQTSANAKTLMAAAYHVPVYVGSRVPYGGSTRDPVPDGSFIHGTDGFGGLGGSVSDCDASSAVQPSASEWMVSTIRAAPGQVTILSFSPLTNLALALALEPSLPRLVRRVILMGGALAHAGNASPLAEANFAHDAAAAKAVLDAWAAHAATDVHQLVLLPLDVTHQALLSVELQAGLRSRGGPAAQLAARAFAVYQDGYCRYGQMCDGAPVHDAMVVAFATHPHLFRVETKPLQVVVDATGAPGAAHGMTFVDRRPLPPGSGTNVSIVMSVEAHAFVELLVERVACVVPYVSEAVRWEAVADCVRVWRGGDIRQ
jgi:purine nucleosidase